MTTKMQTTGAERDGSARVLAQRLIVAGMLGVTLVLISLLIFVLSDFVPLLAHAIS